LCKGASIARAFQEIEGQHYMVMIWAVAKLLLRVRVRKSHEAEVVE
jgi:hypothetical protein